MFGFGSEKAPKWEFREMEGVVRRVGLLNSSDTGADYWAMLLEGNPEPIRFRASDCVALALTEGGDEVRLKLAKHKDYPWHQALITSFTNLTLGIRDEKETAAN